MDDPNDPSISIKDALNDEKRIKYHNDYLSNLLASIKYVLIPNFMMRQILYNTIRFYISSSNPNTEINEMYYDY